MGHSVGDGLIMAALAGALVAYFYFRHVERRRRLEIIHQERVAAMDNGIPLPELPLDPTSGLGTVGPPGAPDARAGVGGARHRRHDRARLRAVSKCVVPLAAGHAPRDARRRLILYYLLASERGR